MQADKKLILITPNEARSVEYKKAPPEAWLEERQVGLISEQQ